jgi:hypothetical protein
MSWWVGKAFCLALLVTFLGVGVSQGRESELEPPPEVPETLLGSGSIGGYRWAVFAGLDGESPDPRRPCIKVATGEGEETGYGTTQRMCIPLDVEPKLNGMSTGVAEETRTVLGMAFPRRVRSVRLWLEGRGSRLVRLRLLNTEQAAFAGLTQFRYAAEGIAGPFCLRRVATYGAGGRRLATGPRYECGWNWMGQHEPG